VRLLGQRLVVVFARGVGVEREVELVDPAELEARARARRRAAAPPDGPWRDRGRAPPSL
jgi:hypothetical protein